MSLIYGVLDMIVCIGVEIVFVMANEIARFDGLNFFFSYLELTNN
jgi:hypothetical protein